MAPPTDNTPFFNRVTRVGFQEVGQDGVDRYEGLRIAFEVTKTDGPTPNTGKITVWNLSEDSVARLQATPHRVFLWAGYKGSEGLVFLGDITQVEAAKEGTERVVTITSGDGQNALTSARISKSYAGQTDPADIIGDLGAGIAEKLGADKAQAKARIKDKVSSYLPKTTGANPNPRGQTFSGQASTELRKALRANKLDFMVEDGELKIVKPGEDTEGGEAYYLTPDTGLIGSPVMGDKGRLGAKTLLIPVLRPTGYVKIESHNFSGFYIIRSLRFIGDSGWDRPYYVELELKEANPS